MYEVLECVCRAGLPGSCQDQMQDEGLFFLDKKVSRALTSSQPVGNLWCVQTRDKLLSGNNVISLVIMSTMKLGDTIPKVKWCFDG